MKHFNKALIAVCLSMSVASQAQLVNQSFEDPSLGNGVFTTTGINGWSHFGSVGVWNPSDNGHFSDPIPDGSQVGIVNTGGTVAQVSTTALVEGDNSVSFWLGRRLDGIQGQTLVDVWGGGFANGGQVVGGTAIGFLVVDSSEIGVGEFVQYTVTRSLLAGDPLIGQNIGVRFAILSGSQVDFDNVTINTVPEPATLLFLVPGLLLARRRRAN